MALSLKAVSAAAKPFSLESDPARRLILVSVQARAVKAVEHFSRGQIHY
jgi:hypothetical protein